MTMASNIISTQTFDVNFPVERGDLMLVYDMMDDVEKEVGGSCSFFLIKKLLLRNC